MPRQTSASVPPSSREPIPPTSPPADPPPVNDSYPEEADGDFCRVEMRTLDETGGLGPLFPGKNRHKPGHSTLACTLLSAAAMTASAPTDTRPRGLAHTPPTHSSTATASTLIEAEQPRFHDGLRVLTPAHREGPLGLQLRAHEEPPAAKPRALGPMVSAPSHTQATRRVPRGNMAIPLAMLAGISLLGYVAAIQSVSAFQSAWRNTDTRSFEESARAQAAYRPDHGQIPAPFAPLAPMTEKNPVGTPADR